MCNSYHISHFVCWSLVDQVDVFSQLYNKLMLKINNNGGLPFSIVKIMKIDNIDLTEQVTLSIFSDFRSIRYIDRILESKYQITSHKENTYRALFLRVWAGNFYHFVVNASVNIAAEHHRLVCCSLIGADGVKVMLILDCYLRNPMCLNVRGRLWKNSHLLKTKISGSKALKG